MRPTPIHKWELPGVPSGFEVFVKRDDMTGSTLGGNKVCWKVVLKNHMPLILWSSRYGNWNSFWQTLFGRVVIV